MASRVSFGARDPFTIDPLQEDAANPPFKKRKTGHIDDDWAKQTISIRAHGASLSDEPYVLEPIAVIPRCRLPFSWLDCSPTLLSEIQPGSLFVADIPILEAHLQIEPVVLAVRLASDGGLYVVERVKKGIYALSKLAHGVEEGDVILALKGWSPSRVEQAPRRLSAIEEGGDWWLMAQIGDPVTDSQFSSKRTKFDVSVVFGVTGVVGEEIRVQDVSPMDSSESRSQSLAPHLALERGGSFDMNTPTALGDSQECGGVLSVDESMKAESLQSPQELLDNLREQYLQALYISKTSVAYFAKGPLARCRTVFQSSELGSAQPTELIEFYRETVLTAKKMDLKYRETLPSTLKDVVLSISDDEFTLQKKRKSRKKKLGKNGLYPSEDQCIRKWWKGRALVDQGMSTETSQEVELKRHIADLRLRETQLQILLILETMALETAITDEAQPTEDGDGRDTVKKSKPKKLQDLKVMLELHLDRLCIWHAVSFDDVAVSEPNKLYGENDSGSRKVESDAVRDFCTEVIIPFYASRLPDKCKSITRKLGVSGAISPFPKMPKPKNIPRAEPGMAIERQHSHRHPRRTLQRVLTDEQTASQGRRQPLSRSNTMPTQSERESMEPWLPSLGGRVRGGIQKAKRVENREVDLNAVARQHEAKLKKVQMLMDQKKELDAAIHALRKPNRELVAKDIAEDAEKRRTGGSARKPKNPVRNPFGQGVQVAATPKGSRKRDAIVGLPPLPRNISTCSSSQPKSSSFFGGDGSPQMVIPASTMRPKTFSDTSSSRDVNAFQETPSRRPTQPLGAFDGLRTGVAESPFSSGNLFRVPRRPAPRSTEMAPSTPVASRRINARPEVAAEPTSSLVMETPPKQSLTVPLIQADGPAETAAATPARVLGTPVKDADRLTVPATTTVPVTPEKSIYAHLGWDDDLGL